MEQDCFGKAQDMPECQHMWQNFHFSSISLFLWLWKNKFITDIEIQLISQALAVANTLCVFSQGTKQGYKHSLD